MRQLVLHGFPTTTTRTDDAAYRWMALPSSTKIGPFLRIRSPRSMPGPRGTDPTRSTQSAWSCVSARSADALTRSSSGYAPSSSSMSTPLALSIICGMSARRRSISVSGPNISPDAMRGRTAYATWPVAPVTTTLTVLIRGGLLLERVRGDGSRPPPRRVCGLLSATAEGEVAHGDRSVRVHRYLERRVDSDRRPGDRVVTVEVERRVVDGVLVVCRDSRPLHRGPGVDKPRRREGRWVCRHPCGDGAVFFEGTGNPEVPGVV